MYVGSSRTNVYREAIRHFYPYNDAYDPLLGFLLFNPFGQRRVYFDPDKDEYLIRVVLVKKPEDAPRLEAALIAKEKPEMNQRTEKTVIEDEEEKELRKEYEQTKKEALPEDEEVPF